MNSAVLERFLAYVGASIFIVAVAYAAKPTRYAMEDPAGVAQQVRDRILGRE